jgi:hypothetical protein
MKIGCQQGASQAKFLWVTAKGLLASNFEKVISDGPSHTLFRWGNAPPVPLCGQCCMKQTVGALESRGLNFIEVCGPRSENGFVIPMGY